MYSRSHSNVVYYIGSIYYKYTVLMEVYLQYILRLLYLYRTSVWVLRIGKIRSLLEVVYYLDTKVCAVIFKDI